jgi:hypothetical protein
VLRATATIKATFKFFDIDASTLIFIIPSRGASTATEV